MSFIADRTAGRIWTNLIYSNPQGPAGVLSKKIFQNSHFLKKIQKRGDNSKNLFSVKKTTRGQTDPAAPGLSASWKIKAKQGDSPLC